MRLPNWLGDTVMAVPALRAIRDGFPSATVLGAGPWAPVLAGQRLADVLVEYPRGWSGRFAAADRVREFRPELAVLLPNSLEAALGAWYWRAPRRVGFDAGGRGRLLTDAPPLPSPRRHQVDEYLALAERLGVPGGTRAPVLAPPLDGSAERAGARRLLAASGVVSGDGRVVVAVHLGAAYGSAKLWPADRIAELVREVQRDGGQAVLLGPPTSADVAHAVTGGAPTPSLVGRDTPAMLPALLAEVDVLVGGDTGVSHLAAALGTPVVALFGPTDPGLTAPRGPAAVVRHPVPCAPCFYRQCPIDHPCMAGITAGEVRARAWSLLAGGGAAAGAQAVRRGSTPGALDVGVADA